MKRFERIVFHPSKMGGTYNIRGTYLTVSFVLELIESGYTSKDILKNYPYINESDIKEVLEFSVWQASEIEEELETVGNYY